MAILVNLASVLPQPTGLATYSLNLVKALDPRAIDVIAPFTMPGFNCYPAPTGMTAKDGLKGHLRRLLWTQWQLPAVYNRLKSQLLFSPIPEAPLWSDCRWIATVHDLIPLRFPKRLSPATLYNRHYIPQVLQQAQHVIANSKATAEDVMRFCQIPASKITPIPLAYDAQNFRFLDLPTQNYFLYLGRINPYKNVQRLIAAFAALPDRLNYELWLAGPPDPRYRAALDDQIQQLGIAAQIRFLNYVAYEDLPSILNQAIALVFPSLWEGFGLPVLEAMACGTPAITSNLASLPEVAGDAALLVDPYDVDAIAQAMATVARDPTVRSQLRTAGLARAGTFSWAKTAQATMTLLNQYQAND